MALSYIRTLTVLSLTLLSSDVGAHPTQRSQDTDISQYHVPLSNGSFPPFPSIATAKPNKAIQNDLMAIVSVKKPRSRAVLT